MPKRKLSSTDAKAFLAVLEKRFFQHEERHKGLSWEDVKSRLMADGDALRSLFDMEDTGGEPDVVGKDKKSGVLTFMDCAPESPSGRRSLCYDDEALEARKEHKPRDSAAGMAARMGIDLLTEEQYRHLQTLGTFDQKTSSWLSTPASIRKLGGALFADYRFGRVFTYHNGVQSYYAGRGFRGCITI